MDPLFERTYGSYLKQGGVEEHFYDDLCGELDQNLADENGKWEEEDSYTGIAVLEDGRSLKVEMYLSNETSDSEWICKAYINK